VTTLLNISGTFGYNSTEGGSYQAVVYYIALSCFNGIYAPYIQPVIIILLTNNGEWAVAWGVQAIAPSGSVEYNENSIILYGSGHAVTLYCTFNLTIKANLNSQGEITSAWVYIENAKTGQVYFNQTVNLEYPILDKQVFFEVEDPLNDSKPVPFPIIPSSNYVFVNALASNSTWLFEAGLPFSDGTEFIMKPPHATAYVIPTFGPETQGVQYYW